MTFRNRFFGYIFFACTLLYLFNACSNDDSSTNTSGTQTITVTITEPADGFATSQSDLVSFSGTALYDNSNTQLPADSLRWRSDVDGEIGIGNQFNRNGLSPGTHQVTLTANGASGESGSASIQFTAQQKTTGVTIVITSPPSGLRLKSHDLLELKGEALDSNDDAITDHLDYQWSSNLDGILGNGPRIIPGDFSPGLHTISLLVKAKDNSGLDVVGIGNVDLLVTADNSPDIAMTILQPQDGIHFQTGEEITFSGQASESNTAITGTDLVWTSSMQVAPIGIGETCIVNNMVAGTHRVTMKAVSPSGKTSVTSIIVHVQE